jgi:hypothetical protein
MKHNKVIVGTIVFLLLLSTASFAQYHERGWQLLGEAHVDGRVDHDNISVGYRGSFRSIQLRVENGPIEFDRVVVHYENGSSEVLQVRQVIPAGGHTRDIDLRGDRRNIRSVELWYGKAAPHSGRPRVTLFGRS